MTSPEPRTEPLTPSPKPAPKEERDALVARLRAPVRNGYDAKQAADTIESQAAENAELRARLEEAKELADFARLLGPAREVLDRCAEMLPGSAREAERMAQQIVDLIGHPVTEEPPHALVRLREAEAERDAALRLLEEVRAALPAGSPFPHRPIEDASCIPCRILFILTTTPTQSPGEAPA